MTLPAPHEVTAEYLRREKEAGGIHKAVAREIVADMARKYGVEPSKVALYVIEGQEIGEDG